MENLRTVTRTTTCLITAALLLAGCGGGSGSDDRRDEIVETLTSQGAADEEQANCIADRLYDALDDDQIAAIDLEAEEESDPEIAGALQDAAQECFQ